METPADPVQLPPGTDWSLCGEHDHLVQFYEGDVFLVNAIRRFIGNALVKVDGAIVIGTPPHRDALEERLHAQGLDLAAARRTEQYVSLDAAATLSTFMVDGWPDENRFRQVLGSVISKVSSRYPHVQTFGEMSALLWADGNSAAAIQLEKLWNELAKVQAFSLCCAYPLNGFAKHVHSEPFLEVCAQHTHVIPAEKDLALTSADRHFRTRAELKQKTAALLSEIEEHKKTHQALQQREQELSDFLEHAAEGLHHVGPDGTILWANRAELDLLGLTADEYIGHHIAEFHAESDAIQDILGRLMRGDTLRDYPARLRRKDGSIRHVLIQSNARWDEGKLMHTRCFTRDVTDRVQLEELLHNKLKELADADQNKDEFLAMLGHELRNPLSPILTALEILRLPGADAADVRTAHEAIGHQTRHLAHIVDDLLDVTRINGGKIQLRNELIDLATVVRRSVETMRPLLDANRHRLSVTLPANTVLVNGDATRLEQVFTNLLANSAKYMNADGEISLVAALSGDQVVISVEDKGVGINAELLPRIFELFTQAERSLDRSHGGLGIGLWMARRLIELHHGEIDAFSAGAGKGSTFEVHLPVAKLQQGVVDDAPSKAATPRAGAQVYRIMVVDDNRDSADVLALLLRMSGHVVQTAHDGLAAIQIASAFHPDVALLDIGLPGLDGYTVARELRQAVDARPMCLIAVTGYGQEEDRRRSREAGFDHHLTKPVEPALLTELLSRPLHELMIA